MTHGTGFGGAALLRLGSEPKQDEPFGEWLDMLGRRWAQSADGRWTQVGGG